MTMRRNGLLSDAFLDGGTSYSESRIDAVFRRARVIDDIHEVLGIRHDCYGNQIRRSAHGNRDHPMGWEIDHIFPQSLGGSDDLTNLQPLHWRANVAKSDMSFLSGLFK
jgi:hypothetical protein